MNKLKLFIFRYYGKFSNIQMQFYILITVSRYLKKKKFARRYFKLKSVMSPLS
jgi:hypothetical protein